jgi:hypothetical protein
MTHSASRRRPSKHFDGHVGPKQEASASSREDNLSQDHRKPSQQVSTAIASLLTGPETRLMTEADNVGLEELVAALTRIPIPRRRKN